MKKLFFLFVALLATTSLWAHDFEVDGIYYNYLDDNNVAVTYKGSSYNEYSNEYSGSVTILSAVTYKGTTYSVTSIGALAFYNCSSLTSVTIPNSVTSIGEDAFYECSSLTSITIPNNVKSIGNYAFCYCSSLTSITIGNSVTSIGNYAFSGCSDLTSLTIGESVTSIRSSAFSGCSSLTKTNYAGDIAGWCDIKFGNSSANPISYSHNFFINDQEIKDLVIPNSVDSIHNYAFCGCSSLTSVTIPNSVTSIGEYAFRSCSSLTSVTIPNSVTSIGEYAFDDCSSLDSVTIGNSVTSIGDYAFYNCSSLTSITIPNSVTSIGNSAFSGCSSLESVTIPNSVTSIGEGAFEDCESLASIIIPNSVTSIGEGAFYDCSSLTSITIGNRVTSIGDYAFGGCSKLTSVTINSDAIVNKAYSEEYNISNIFGSQVTEYIIGESVTSIGDYAFYSCSSLDSVTIGNSVKSIGDYAFYECFSLTSITIPNSVTSIGEGAFSSCYSLTSVTIPNSVTSIEDYTFSSCPSLASITIGNRVTSIGDVAFGGCTDLTSITIPNSVTSIGDEAFGGCSSLTSITCEAETPPTVGPYAFEGVSQSIPIYVPCGCVEAYKAASGWSDFTNIQGPLAEYSIEVDVNDATMGTAKVDKNNACGSQISASPNIGYHFVQWSDGNTDNPRTLELTQNTALTAEFAQSFSGQCGDNLYWNYDETTKTISITGSGKMYDYTATTQPWILFKEDIKEVTISNKATSIGISAFEGCVRLGKLSIGTGIEHIAANAFAGCLRLYDIYCYAYPPFAEETSFANYNVYVYVPCEYQRDYTLDVVWGKFKFIECLESEDVTTDGNVTIVPGYNDVTITWPTDEGADTYTIVIKKDGKVVCTHTFNSEGQLISIAFAPGRDGNHPAQYAEAVANGKGFRFTVTGLEEGTHYTYNIDVKNTANQTINSHTGAFTTQSTTAVDNITTNNANTQKLLRNGQLIILRDGVEYNAMGQEIGN